MTTLLAWAWLFTLPGLALTAFGVPGGQRRAGWASLPGPIVLLIVALLSLGGPAYPVEIPNWLPFLPDGAFRTLVDPLSTVMLVVLGVVASLVYIYSLGYMADDPGKRRFFVYLDFFVAAMAILVLAGNLAVLLIGWTGVGVASFLLISFWRDREGTLFAGLQALAANAIGDGALLLAATMVPIGCGTLTTLGAPECAGGVPGGAETLALLLFIAAGAKSAQGPLYFWLPSAMAGPTPISALIHAATMVAAGVYLLVRTHALLDQAPTVQLWIAGIAVATAIAASVASFLQPNFKRGVAYSTVAQLGYMFAAIGVGAPFAAFFHLFTHAFFKALLFLSAGVVIHGEGGEESLARLSGRGRKYTFSYWGFLLGSLALIGVPLFSGAFSKDVILETAMEHQPVVGYLLLASVVLTGLYAGRLFFRVYHGPLVAAAPSGSEAHEPVDAHHAHDPAAARYMDLALVPLMVLAVVSGYAGLVGVGPLPGLLQPLLPDAHGVPVISSLGLIAAALGLAGFGISYLITRKPPERAEAAVAGPAPWVSAFAGISYSVSRGIASVQTGRLVSYAFISVFTAAAIVLLQLLSR